VFIADELFKNMIKNKQGTSLFYTRIWAMHNAVAKPIFGSERLWLADKLQIIGCTLHV